MRRINYLLAGTLVAVAALAGCEWTGSSESGGSWDNTYDFVNFSATYRRAGGAVATVQAATVTPDGSSSVTNAGPTTTTTKVALHQVDVTTRPGQTQFAGEYLYNGVARHDVDPSTVFVKIGNFGFNGQSSGTWTGNVECSGSLNKDGWSIRITGSSAIEAGTPILLGFSFDTTSAAGGTASSSSSSSAKSQTIIYTITVQQVGQHLTMTASNGQVFTGTINGMNLSTSLKVSAVVNASFSVKDSKTGNYITGTLTDNTAQRVLNGSWVQGKNVLDVYGTASPCTRIVNYEASDDDDTKVEAEKE